MSHNPWAGLASYQDPAAGSTLLFCGRDNESYDLAALVDDNIYTKQVFGAERYGQDDM